MSKLKQLIGLQSSNLSVRALARALDLSIGAVSKYLRAVRAAGIGTADAEGLSEAELELRVFGPTTPTKANALVAPDCAWIHNELKRHRHVTLQLLWEEYAERYGEAAYRRSAFCAIVSGKCETSSGTTMFMMGRQGLQSRPTESSAIRR